MPSTTKKHRARQRVVDHHDVITDAAHVVSTAAKAGSVVVKDSSGTACMTIIVHKKKLPHAI